MYTKDELDKLFMEALFDPSSNSEQHIEIRKIFYDELQKAINKDFVETIINNTNKEGT